MFFKRLVVFPFSESVFRLLVVFVFLERLGSLKVFWVFSKRFRFSGSVFLSYGSTLRF